MLVHIYVLLECIVFQLPLVPIMWLKSTIFFSAPTSKEKKKKKKSDKLSKCPHCFRFITHKMLKKISKRHQVNKFLITSSIPLIIIKRVAWNFLNTSKRFQQHGHWSPSTPCRQILFSRFHQKPFESFYQSALASNSKPTT